jgi:hypothetical protein
VAHREVGRRILEAADRLNVGETVALASKVLPFELRLHLRFKEDSRLILYTDIEGDPEELRLERVRRALDAKCPKLANWARKGRTSILIIEADDIQHERFRRLRSDARALRERSDQPDIVVLNPRGEGQFVSAVHDAAARRRQGGARRRCGGPQAIGLACRDRSDPAYVGSGPALTDEQKRVVRAVLKLHQDD